MRKANYSKSENPPILHRKETFVFENYPEYQTFSAITKEGEQANLYEKSRTIGFRKSWLQLIRSKGYFLDEKGRLHHSDTQEQSNTEHYSDTEKVERHKTAINRNKLSAPMQILARHNYFDGQYSTRSE